MKRGTSLRFPSDIINGKWSYCQPLVSPQARAADEDAEPLGEIILSPLANNSDVTHERFMDVKTMLGFGPWLEMHSFYTIPKESGDEVCQQWVQLHYWNEKLKKKELSEL